MSYSEHNVNPPRSILFGTINCAYKYSRAGDLFMVDTPRGVEWWKNIGFGKPVEGFAGQLYARYEFKVIGKASESDIDEALVW